MPARRSSVSAAGEDSELRRSIVLAALVVVSAALAVLVRGPERRMGLYAVRGHRVFSMSRHAVLGADVRLGDRRFMARRTEHGWEIDGRAASPGTADALEDLLDTLIGLRAVDVFRSREMSSFGLEQPRATIELVTARRPERLLIGGLNAAGSALYARRADDPRVFQIGILLLTEIERVFYNRDGPGPAGRVSPSAQRPEIGYSGSPTQRAQRQRSRTSPSRRSVS